MGIYRNQAQRVYDTIKAKGGDEYILKTFGVSVDSIEEAIEKAVEKSKLNGYKCADAIIKMWEEQKKTIDAATE